MSAQLEATAAAAFTASLKQTSFLGGQITVTGQYISDSAVLKVGGFEGKVLSSTTSDAVFEIPPLLTPNVLTTFPELDVSSRLGEAEIISDGGSAPEKVFDELTSTTYSSSNADCYVGIDLGAGRVANIRRIRYFPTMEWNIVSTYLKGAVF